MGRGWEAQLLLLLLLKAMGLAASSSGREGSWKDVGGGLAEREKRKKARKCVNISVREREWGCHTSLKTWEKKEEVILVIRRGCGGFRLTLYSLEGERPRQLYCQDGKRSCPSYSLQRAGRGRVILTLGLR